MVQAVTETTVVLMPCLIDNNADLVDVVMAAKAGCGSVSDWPRTGNLLQFFIGERLIPRRMGRQARQFFLRQCPAVLRILPCPNYVNWHLLLHFSKLVMDTWSSRPTLPHMLRARLYT